MTLDTEQRNSKGQYLPGNGPWQPGESGNPSGRPPDSVTTLLKLKDRKKVADKLYELAISGELAAIREYLDRTEGKVTDKLLSVNVSITPELLEQAQKRLTESKNATQELLEEYNAIQRQGITEASGQEGGSEA